MVMGGYRWRLDVRHEDIWLVRQSRWGGADGLPSGMEPLTAAAAIARVSSWFPEGWGGDDRLLAQICLSLEGDLAANGAPEGAWLRHTLRRALQDGRLIAFRRKLPAPAGEGAEEEQAPAPQRAVREEKTWVEIVLTEEGEPRRPMAFAKYRICPPDGSPREGMLDANGRARIEGIDPGECEVTFPQLDAEAWTRDGVKVSPQPRGSAGTTRVIRQGNTTEALAVAAGLFWGTIWDHPRNAALRARRRSPNILLAGDELFIPERMERSEPCATARVHRFRRRGIPSELRIQCLDEEQNPYANTPYYIVGDDVDLRGTLDAKGWLRVPIAPEVQRLRLLIGENGDLDERELLMGHLDPLDEPTGICDRLRNLGYYDGPSVVETSDVLRDAVRWFQKDAGLEPTGEIDDALRDALRGGHHA